MTTEEAKKIADAIVLGMTATYGKTPTADELKQKCIKILTADTAAPVEKEYRAGEWVPEHGKQYWLIDWTNDGKVMWSTMYGNPRRDEYDTHRLSQGNVFPTEAIAEAAKKHAEFWRAFDMADEGGEWGLLMESGKLECVEVIGPDGTPRFLTEGNGLAAIERLGGEPYVSEMLTKGRVFRFKWGGE